jgi:hypothetical protein
LVNSRPSSFFCFCTGQLSVNIAGICYILFRINIREFIKTGAIFMNRPLNLLLVLVFMTLLGATAFGQTSPSPTPTPKPKAEEPKKDDAGALLGKWDVVFSAPGQDYAGTLTLSKDGDNFKGSVVTELGESPLSNVKVKDDAFTANIIVNAQGQAFEGTIAGKTKEGKLSGELVLGGLGTIPYTGKKS